MNNLKIKKVISLILTVFMVLAVVLSMVVVVQAEGGIIPNGDYTISANGEYQLSEDYSGTITIASNVNTVTVSDSVYGTPRVNTSIVIEGGRLETLELTIENLHITTSDYSIPAIDFSSAGNYENILYISGTCSVASSQAAAGINVPEGVRLTIDKAEGLSDDDTAQLTATGGRYGAGIGGNAGESGGTINIIDGTVAAESVGFAAGIGGGYGGTGGNISISGGIVTATGGIYGAAIGSGWEGIGGNINISGGTVTAIGTYGGAGIGGGRESYSGIGGDGGNINISGGTVTATSGGPGAAIGGGHGGSAGNISISAGTVNATGFGGAGIGNGYEGQGGSIYISGGTIEVVGGIGGGGGGAVGTITITDGIITATNDDWGRSGIGGGSGESGGTIIISGGTITAAGGTYAAGIGGGQNGAGGDINISGGTVDVIGGVQAAGIGGGVDGSGGNISISEGTVTAVSVFGGAGIGGGIDGENGNITISGGIVTATSDSRGAGIGGGNEGGGGTITINGGVVEASGGTGSYSDANTEGGAGIGGGYNGVGGVITINGGTVKANGGYNAAGIGGGRYAAGGVTNISGGTIEAYGGNSGAGIGGGWNAAGGTVNISGGTIEASGGYNAAGIGGGYNGSGASVIISGTPIVIATGNPVSNAEHIGHGETWGTLDSGTLRNDSDVDLSYLRFSTREVTGAKISMEGIDSEYQTNDQGLFATFHPRYETVKYTVSKYAYRSVRDSVVLSKVSHGIDVEMIKVQREVSNSVPKLNETAEITSEDERLLVELVFDKKIGNAIVSVDEKLLEEIFGKAKADESGRKTIRLEMPEIERASSYTLEAFVTSLSSDSTEKEILFSTPFGKMGIPSNMLTELESIAGKKVAITIGNGDKTNLPSDVREAIGDRPMVQITLSIDGKTVAWNNPEVPVTVSIPYTPTEDEQRNSEHIVVWYIDGEGNVVSIPSGRYNPETGMVTFTTTHFSYYAVAYVHKTFNDLSSVAWAKKSIEVMASKGIINGTGKDSYSPEANITRADYLVLLVKTLGLTAEFDHNFEDVEDDTYYYDALGIAKKLGIVTGIGNNRFNPKENISRQDMMVMTAQALKNLKNLENPETSSVLDKFSDKGNIADYALADLAAIVREGLIVGTGDRINPRAYTTRAEAAVFLYKIYNKY